MKMSATAFRSGFLEEGISKTYTIAFSPRCGSTLLSNVLTAAGAGKPTEYFQYPYAANEYFKDKDEQSLLRSFQSIVREYCANHLFSSKMAHDHRAHLDELLSRQIVHYEGIDSIFPDHRWIFMRRKDLIGQAISLYFAEETGVWHLRQNQSSSSVAKVQYDFFSILSRLMILLANNFNWELYFHKNALFPLTVFYEDFIADQESALKLVAAYIGVGSDSLTNPQTNAQEKLAKISDRHKELYEDLRERFTDDFLRIGQKSDRDRLGPGLDRWNAFFFQRLWRAERNPPLT
jgi:trehalose 2-sulfotransferase